MQYMITSLRGMIEIAQSEGICLSKYKDSVGVWTIGLGSTRSDIPDLNSWPMDKKITIEQAFEMFQLHLKKYEQALNKHLKRQIKQYEFDALVSWCYNVGPGWLKTATVIRRINNGESGKRLYDALMMYQKPIEIKERRKREANLLAYGDYDYGGPNLVNLFPVSSSGRPMYNRGKLVDPLLYLKPYNPPAPTIDKEFEKTKINKKAVTLKENIIIRIINYILSLFKR